MRWLLRKDLLILRRSRLLVALLIVYPVAIALLIGLAISRSPARPRVAIVDETPPGETLAVGTQRVPVAAYARQLFDQVQAVDVSSRARAIAKVRSGEVLAAVVIPPNIAARVASATEAAQLEVLYNGDALEQSLVQSTLNSALAQANLGFSAQIQKAAADASSARCCAAARSAASAPPGGLIGLAPDPADARRRSSRTSRADMTAPSSNGLTRSPASPPRTCLWPSSVLSIIAQPIRVNSVAAARTPHAAGHVRGGRRGDRVADARVRAARRRRRRARARRAHARAPACAALVSREALLAEKTLLAAACAFVLAFAMLAGIGAFVALDWGRVGAVAARARLRRARLWRARRRDRRARARGARRLAARLPAVAAARVSRARTRRLGVRRLLRRDRRDLVRVPLQGRPAGARRRRQRLLAGDRLCRSLHLAVLAVVFAALARVGLRQVE